MIAQGARLRIERIPLSRLRVIEHEACYPEKFAIYLDLLTSYPEQDVDSLIVCPTTGYLGMFDIRNGKHRYCSSIMAGRTDVLCIIVEEETTKQY